MASPENSMARADQELLWRPAVNPWLIALSVILPTFMEVLDTSIANVALNHIAGSMSATYSEATWVLTSYLIANAIVLPLTAWLGNRFRRKRFLLGCIVVFTLSSLMCGLSVNLPMLLLMRVIQGLGGGGLVPVSQAILMESFPPKRQGAAQAFFGLGVVVAPVVGPILGGWLTDSYSWRWIFYINVPIGMLALWAVQQTVEDPPWVVNSKPGPLDAVGFLALSVWLGCQEVFLDKGQENDWLGSRFIRWMIVLAVAGFFLFLWRELTTEKPMVDLRIFRHRNFGVGTALMFFTGLLLYAIGLVTPEFLQQLMGYSAFAAGVVTSPLGIGSAVAMILLGRLVMKFDTRLLIAAGFLMVCLAAYRLSAINLQISPWSILWPQIIAGAGIGFLFVPINVACPSELRRDELGSATGTLNLMRNVGGSVGIALVSTFLARRAQVRQNLLVQHIAPGKLQLATAVRGIQGYLAIRMPASGDGSRPAAGLIYRFVQQQAALLAFTDVYRGIMVLGLLCLLLVILMRKTKVTAGASLLH